MKTIKLKRPVIFLEFFVRTVEFVGRDKAKDIPANTLFYLGKSLAKEVKYYDQKLRKWETSYDKFFGFKDGKPVVKQGSEDKLEIKDNARDVNLVAKEYFDVKDNKWYRANDQVIIDSKKTSVISFGRTFNYNPLPFLFDIKGIDKDGTLTTDFPRAKTPLEVGKTYAYLCHRQQYQTRGVKAVSPNVYLVLFVRNHGMHKETQVISEEDFVDIDSAKLAEAKPIQVRDFRKSNIKFEF